MKPPLFFVLLISIFLSCPPPSPKVESVLSLAPPTDVGLHCESDSCLITWRASRHEDLEEFAGYRIYISKTSLIFVSPNELLKPLTAEKDQKRIKIAKPENAAFVHLRSFTSDGKISLPSLPELKIENNKE
jgi:hypothetical protein